MRIYTQTREQTSFRAYNVRSRVQHPMFGERYNALLLLSKPPAKTILWSGSQRFWLTPQQKKSPGGISEAMRYGIVSPLGLRPEAQRQCRQSPTAVPDLLLYKQPPATMPRVNEISM